MKLVVMVILFIFIVIYCQNYEGIIIEKKNREIKCDPVSQW
jgi:hypothetical protein